MAYVSFVSCCAFEIKKNLKFRWNAISQRNGTAYRFCIKFQESYVCSLWIYRIACVSDINLNIPKREVSGIARCASRNGSKNASTYIENFYISLKEDILLVHFVGLNWDRVCVCKSNSSAISYFATKRNSSHVRNHSLRDLFTTDLSRITISIFHLNPRFNCTSSSFFMRSCETWKKLGVWTVAEQNETHLFFSRDRSDIMNWPKTYTHTHTHELRDHYLKS